MLFLQMSFLLCVFYRKEQVTIPHIFAALHVSKLAFINILYLSIINIYDNRLKVPYQPTLRHCARNALEHSCFLRDSKRGTWEAYQKYWFPLGKGI